MMLSARALVVPSQWYEVVGRVALEAFAAGLPVLASDIGGLGEVVREPGAECLVPADDRNAWATALTRLGDDASVDAMGSQPARSSSADTPTRSVWTDCSSYTSL